LFANTTLNCIKNEDAQKTGLEKKIGQLWGVSLLFIYRGRFDSQKKYKSELN